MSKEMPERSSRASTDDQPESDSGSERLLSGGVDPVELRCGISMRPTTQSATDGSTVAVACRECEDGLVSDRHEGDPVLRCDGCGHILVREME